MSTWLTKKNEAVDRAIADLNALLGGAIHESTRHPTRQGALAILSFLYAKGSRAGPDRTDQETRARDKVRRAASRALAPAEAAATKRALVAPFGSGERAR